MFEHDEALRRFGQTGVDNLFLTDYLPAAKGDYVKVYLYGLFLCSHPQADLSLTELSKTLMLTEGEVEAALRYWERYRLVQRLSDAQPRYRFRSPLQLLLSGEGGLEADTAFVAFSEDVYALFEERRKVRPADIALAWEWVQDLHLPHETVLMLLSHCISTRGVQFSFQSAQKLAVRMCERGAVTVEDAGAFLQHEKHITDGARAVLRRMGKYRPASEDELLLYRTWVEDWSYTPDAILSACSETTKGDPSFAYLNGILKGLRDRAATDGAQRTAAQLSAQLADEKKDREALHDFAKALGQPKAYALFATTYHRLSRQYPAELLLYVARQTHKAGGDLGRFEQAIEALEKRGIKTLSEATAYYDEADAVNRALQPVFDALGKTGRPAPADRVLMRKWQQMGLSDALIRAAAEQSRSAQRPLAYMDKILSVWKQEGVLTPAQAAARKEQAPRPGTSSPAKKVSAQQYTQREYTDEELNALAADIMEEARKLNEQ